MTQRRILIIRPDRIGDVVLTTPLIRAVKQTFPQSYIGVMVSTYTAPLLYHNPHIDTIITDDPEGKDSGRSGFWRQVQKLRELRFDTGLMPLPRERHAWMMLLAGIKTRIGVGGKIYQILTATKSVSRHKYIPLRHEADYVLDLGRKIGVTTNDITPELFVSEAEQNSAKNFLNKQGINLEKPLIGINPASKGSSPNWHPEKYYLLAKELSKEFQLFINIGPKGSGIESHFRNLNGKVLLHAPENLRELVAMCSLLSVLVSSSTGTMHIAASLKVPTVSLFCPLTACSPILWGPLGNTAEIILPPESYCQNRCPGNPKICPFEEITVEHVVHRIKKVIQK